MRVISGTLGGRTFESPHGHKTHPMSEKARGGLFNALGDISKLKVLDCYSGTGALSFEAISRGASEVTAVDNDLKASATIKQNCQDLGITQQVKVIQANVSSWSNNNPDELFDLILVDPPYDKPNLGALSELVTHLKPDGTFVLSWPKGLSIPIITDLAIVHQKNYGDAQLAFYKRIN